MAFLGCGFEGLFMDGQQHEGMFDERSIRLNLFSLQALTGFGLLAMTFGLYTMATQHNRHGDFEDYGLYLFFVVLLASLGVANLGVAYGLDKGLPWARPTAWVLAVITLIIGCYLAVWESLICAVVIVIAVAIMYFLTRKAPSNAYS